MRETQAGLELASYRRAVVELIGAGEAFGDVEDAIDAGADLSMDEKAALWLFAFSLGDPAEQRRYAQAQLAAL
jgi:hypothetical protein